MFSGNGTNFFSKLVTFPQLDRGMIAAPVFPLLLHLFQYKTGNPWPLAGLFLAGSICLVVAWLIWLHGQGLPSFWLIVFALIPNPIYYMICVGTELPFSIFFAIFFLAYFKDQWTKKDVYIWVTASLLLLLIRPNGISILRISVNPKLLKRRM